MSAFKATPEVAKAIRETHAKQAQEQRERAMFGMPIKLYEEEIERSIARKTLGQHDGRLMYAMSMLSDAQEAMSRGDYEPARQWMNVAKYVISSVMEREKESA